MAKDKYDKPRLIELGKSDFELADDEQNIRGWEVKNNRGMRIGKVDEFLFDPLSRSVRYLVVDIDGKPINLLSRKVPLPTGLVDIHETEDVVVLRNVEVAHLAALPTYKRNEVTPAVERDIRNILTGNTLTPGVEEDERFYDHDHFKHEHLYKRRRVAGYDGDLENERTHRDHHFVERAAKRADSPAGDYEAVKDSKKQNRPERDEPATDNRSEETERLAPFEEGQIEMVERKEVPVVSKKARVIEEIDIHKDVTHRDEVVKDKVRETKVDIEEFDGQGNRRKRKE